LKSQAVLFSALIFCSGVTAFAGVTTTSPASQSQNPNNVHFVASATSPYAPIGTMVINVDSKNFYTINHNSLDTTIQLSTGPHQLVMKAWDTQGHYFDQWINFTAGQNQGQTVVSNIDDLSGWSSCDTCAGPGGHGHPDVHYQVQNLATPSMDGGSSEFYLGKTTDGYHNYSNALWFKRLTSSHTATHFILDYYLYIKNVAVAQGIEMDVFYARDGWKNYFLTECDSRGTYAGTWQVSNAVIDKWQHTGLPCHLQAYSWNHIVLEFLRNSDGSTNFVSLTLNGDKQYVNRTYPAGSVSKSDFELNPAIQLDGDEKQDPITIWVDKMTLTYW
jgi:hypothetical protein